MKNSKFFGFPKNLGKSEKVRFSSTFRKSLFSKIEGDKNTIMGLPVKKIKEYLDKL